MSLQNHITIYFHVKDDSPCLGVVVHGNFDFCFTQRFIVIVLFVAVSVIVYGA